MIRLNYGQETNWDAYRDCPAFTGRYSINLIIFGIELMIAWNNDKHEWNSEAFGYSRKYINYE